MNIFHELRHKNPEQNISTLNPSVEKRIKYQEQVRFIPAVWDEFIVWELIKLIYHINEIEKAYLTKSTMFKSLRKLDLELNLLNRMRDIYTKNLQPT